MVNAHASQAQSFLLKSQNADGGWGYRAGGMSYVEPTAVVLLALSGPEANDARQRARDFLLSLQRPDGGWGIAAVDLESGWMTAYAVQVLTGFPAAHAAVEGGVEWLLRTEGLRVTDAAVRDQVRSMYHMDSALSGWPWQPGDAAWVHPTGLAIIALIAGGRGDHPRVRAGVEFLLDRAVEGGGWNIGNPEMIGKRIPSTPQDTSVALVALRAAGVSGDDARVRAGIEYLRQVVSESQTPSELAWAIEALSRWNTDVNSSGARLMGLQLADGSWQGNPLVTAMALRTGLV